MTRHLLSIPDLKPREILQLIVAAKRIKQRPAAYRRKLYQRTLLMLFQAPSLRTRISFETAMVQLGGEAINYSTAHSPWGMGKESIEDVARVISRYCDGVMARIYDHGDLRNLAEHASIPVINGMTNAGHPCQILGDMMTIVENKRKLQGLKVAYLGDSNNNVTYSLMEAAAVMGFHLSIGCPKEFSPNPAILHTIKQMAHDSKIEVHANPKKAAFHADVVYTDSWMSYRIPASQKKKRVRALGGYQVNKEIMQVAQRNAIFMHCLPALRGMEVSADVMDGKQSVVFDQAENRLHMQKAILMKFMR